MHFARVFPILLLTSSVLGLSQVTVADETVPSANSCPGGTSPQFQLDGQVGSPSIYTMNQLQALPRTQVTVSFVTGKGPETHTYVGVTLQTLLQASGGFITNPAVKNDVLRKYIVVSATDCYTVVLSEGEFDPKFGAKQVIVAYATKDDPNQDPQPLGDQGAARLVVPGDRAGGRYVSNITHIQVLSAP